MVSFGGAYSNHIHALAYAGKMYGLDTYGIIRGEYDPHNPTIRDILSYGMKLEFISREQYRKRYDEQYLAQIREKHPQAIIVPEGGSNRLALLGVAEVMTELAHDNVDYICTPCGSGGTTAGLLAGANATTKVLSIPVLKNAGYLRDEIFKLLEGKPHQPSNLHFVEGYHFGGYGKIKPELLTFISDFYQATEIEVEPIYSGKMVYAVYDLIKQGYFPRGSHIVLLHTGGLQGVNGLKQRKLLPQQWLGD